MASVRAVIFDLGGVVLGSPLQAIAGYERDAGLPAGFVSRVVVDTGPEGAWGRLERGLLALEAFVPAFEAECAAAGQRLDAAQMMGRMAEAALPRPSMLEAIASIRQRGLLAAALTNNWASDEGGDDLAELRSRFDAFFESCALGLQKPDPRIYLHACESLGVEPGQAAFLDDIGRNLKSARQLGMHTIKVEDPDDALGELSALLGFPLGDGAGGGA